MFFFAWAHQTKYVCCCVHLSFYTQIYSSTILLLSFCPAVTEARNEFTKVAFDLRAPLRLVSLGQRGEAWHTRAHSTVAPAAAAAFVASLISIWRMQVYCVLWGTIYKSAEIISLWLGGGGSPWIFRGENVIKTECRVTEAKGKFQHTETELTTGACSAADSLLETPRRRLGSWLRARSFRRWWKIIARWGTTYSSYSRCHLPFSHARRRLCKIAAERK